jgi:hypothetical protein
VIVLDSYCSVKASLVPTAKPLDTAVTKEVLPGYLAAERELLLKGELIWQDSAARKIGSVL